MSEAPRGGHDSRPGEDRSTDSGPPVPDGDSYSGTVGGSTCSAGAARPPPPSCSNGPAAAEPSSRSVLEALARAQFDAGRYARRPTTSGRSWRPARVTTTHTSGSALPSPAPVTGRCRGAPRPGRGHAPELPHYTEALRGVRATLRAQAGTGPPPQPPPREILHTERPAMVDEAAHPAARRPEPLSSAYDVALLDLDGVVYLGGSAVPGAADALAKAPASGMRLAFVTNNASRTPSAIAAQLTGARRARHGGGRGHLGPGGRPAAGRAPARPGRPCSSSAAWACALAVRERGFRPVTSPPTGRRRGPGLRARPQLLAARRGRARGQAGAWFVASNADATLPTPRGRQPGNGSLIQVIVTATGQSPLIAGKPEPPLHAEAVASERAQHPLVVGDRLDTDIEGAVRSGADSLLVLTGVTRPLDVGAGAAARQRPTYLAEGLAGLLDPHPEVTIAGGTFSLRRLARHHRRRPRLTVTGSGAAIDGLRALCAAAWADR